LEVWVGREGGDAAGFRHERVPGLAAGIGDGVKFGELDELVLACAITVHMAQGPEYPAVVVPLPMQHYPMLKRNLVYTALTRGKRLVVLLVGQKKALAMGVCGRQMHRRWSKIQERLGPAGT